MLVIGMTTNGHDYSQVSYLVRRARLDPDMEVIVSGNHAHAWMRQLDHENISCRITGTTPRRGEAEVQLALEMIEHAMDLDDGEYATYRVVGRPASLQAIAEKLESLGHDARWYPALGPALIEDDHGAVEAIVRLRDLVGQAVHADRRSTVAHIGDVSAYVYSNWPELESRKFRERLFGVRKFRRICEQVGIEVKGDHVYLPRDPGLRPSASRDLAV